MVFSKDLEWFGKEHAKVRKMKEPPKKQDEQNIEQLRKMQTFQTQVCPKLATLYPIFEVVEHPNLDHIVAKLKHQFRLP